MNPAMATVPASTLYILPVLLGTLDYDSLKYDPAQVKHISIPLVEPTPHISEYCDIRHERTLHPIP
jgi:hypothetical protein